MPEQTLSWIHREDQKPKPTIAGHYRVMVSGDSEQIDGHTIYAFDDYETWAYFTPNEDDGGNFVGLHDEEDFCIFAYCGPIIFPVYESPHAR